MPRDFHEKPKKPLYYNEYILKDEPNKNTPYLWGVWGLVFITIMIFLPSIMDIVLSYMEIDKCQEMEYITTLNRWLRFSGACTFVYYIFIFISIYFLYMNNINENYTRMYTTYERSSREINNYFFKIFVSIFTIFILIIHSFIAYSYFLYFNHYCISYTIIIYMWIRLLIGILISIFIFFIIFYIDIEVPQT